MTFRVDKGNRTRYVGQPRRGNPGKLNSAKIDLKLAIGVLEAAVAGIKHATGSDLTDSEREKAIEQVRDHVRRAAGHTRDVVRTLGPGKPKRKDNPAQTKLRFRR